MKPWHGKFKSEDTRKREREEGRGNEGKGVVLVLATSDAQTHMQLQDRRFSLSAFKPMKGQSADILASFIPLDWLFAAAANLGFPPMKRRRGKGAGLRSKCGKSCAREDSKKRQKGG